MTHSNVLILVILKIVLIQDLPKKKKRQQQQCGYEHFN